MSVVLCVYQSFFWVPMHILWLRYGDVTWCYMMLHCLVTSESLVGWIQFFAPSKFLHPPNDCWLKSLWTLLTFRCNGSFIHGYQVSAGTPDGVFDVVKRDGNFWGWSTIGLRCPGFMITERYDVSWSSPFFRNKESQISRYVSTNLMEIESTVIKIESNLT